MIFQPTAAPLYCRAFKLAPGSADRNRQTDLIESECLCLERTSIRTLTTTASHTQSFHSDARTARQDRRKLMKCVQNFVKGGISHPAECQLLTLPSVHRTGRLKYQCVNVAANWEALNRGRTDHFRTKHSTDNRPSSCYLFTVFNYPRRHSRRRGGRAFSCVCLFVRALKRKTA